MKQRPSHSKLLNVRVLQRKLEQLELSDIHSSMHHKHLLVSCMVWSISSDDGDVVNVIEGERLWSTFCRTTWLSSSSTFMLVDDILRENRIKFIFQSAFCNSIAFASLFHFKSHSSNITAFASCRLQTWNHHKKNPSPPLLMKMMRNFSGKGKHQA